MPLTSTGSPSMSITFKQIVMGVSSGVLSNRVSTGKPTTSTTCGGSFTGSTSITTTSVSQRPPLSHTTTVTVSPPL